ncbi:MAG: hypothetical protein KDB26_04360 [Microthrixaceae bacterium]|nr:hypothetical protein [Microthrixaceae bacterium]
MSILEHPSVQGPQFESNDEHPNNPSSACPPKQLVVRPWWDPELAVAGHALASPYVETFWLGVLGPSVICLLRRLARGFEGHPQGFRLSLPDTAKAIGLGAGTGRQAPINRTIDRACTFHIARRVASDEIDVRLYLPSLTARQVSRLPLSIQNSHERWVAMHSGHSRTVDGTSQSAA